MLKFLLGAIKGRLKFFLDTTYWDYSDLIHESDKYLFDFLFESQRVEFINEDGKILSPVSSEVFENKFLWNLSIGVIYDNGTRTILPMRLFDIKVKYKNDKVYVTAKPKYYVYEYISCLNLQIEYEAHIKY